MTPAVVTRGLNWPRTRKRPKAVVDVMGGAESEAEAILANRLNLLHVPPFDTQVLLIPGRKFRFDVAFVEPWKVAIELQGGQHSGGRHNRAAGFVQDSIKSAMAQTLGWIVIAVTPSMVESGVAGLLILEALKARGWRS